MKKQPIRKDIDQYAEFRSSTNMMERALQQPVFKSATKCSQLKTEDVFGRLGEILRPPNLE